MIFAQKRIIIPFTILEIHFSDAKSPKTVLRRFCNISKARIFGARKFTKSPLEMHRQPIHRNRVVIFFYQHRPYHPPIADPSVVKFKTASRRKVIQESRKSLVSSQAPVGPLEPKARLLPPCRRVIIRFRCDANSSDAVLLGPKFGCEPGDEAVRLIRGCRDLGLELHGFSFHAGSPCGEVLALNRGIGHCKHLIDVARTCGLYDVQLIDIGGGVPGDSDFVLDEVWSYFSRLPRGFVFKELLFEYRHLVFWLENYYRTNWRYSRTRTFERKSTYRTVTYKSRVPALPWR